MGTAWLGSLKAKGTGLSRRADWPRPAGPARIRNAGPRHVPLRIGTRVWRGHPRALATPPQTLPAAGAGARQGWVRSGSPAPGHSTTAPGARPPHSCDFRVTLPGRLSSLADFLRSLIRGKVCDPDCEQGWGPRLGQRRLACPSLTPEVLPLLMGLKGAQPPRPSDCSLASPRGWVEALPLLGSISGGLCPQTHPRPGYSFLGTHSPHPATCCSPRWSGALKPLQVGPSGFGLHPELPKGLLGLAVRRAQGDHHPEEAPSPSRPHPCHMVHLRSALSPAGAVTPVPGLCWLFRLPVGGPISRPHVTPWQTDTPAWLSPRAGGSPEPPRPARPHQSLAAKEPTSLLGQAGCLQPACTSRPPLCRPPPPRCLLTSISLSVSVCPSPCVFHRGCSKFNSQ